MRGTWALTLALAWLATGAQARLVATAIDLYQAAVLDGAPHIVVTDHIDMDALATSFLAAEVSDLGLEAGTRTLRVKASVQSIRVRASRRPGARARSYARLRASTSKPAGARRPGRVPPHASAAGRRRPLQCTLEASCHLQLYPHASGPRVCKARGLRPGEFLFTTAGRMPAALRHTHRPRPPPMRHLVLRGPPRPLRRPHRVAA